MARPAYNEAIASFENAIRLCRVLGDDAQWRRREQGLQLELGQALIAKLGHQAPATLHTFERALALADAIGDVSLQLPAMFGQWAARYIAGIEMGKFGGRFAALAEAQPESGPRIVGQRMLGLERFHAGRFNESLALMRQSLAGYDPVAHRDLARQFGHDPRTGAANYEAGTSGTWASLTRPPGQPRTICDGRGVSTTRTRRGSPCVTGVTLVNIWLRRPDRVESAAREALRLAERMSLALWHAWAQTQLGWALSQQRAGTGLDEIEAGLGEAQQIGAGRLDPLHFSLAADAYSRAGRHDEATARMAKAFTALTRCGDVASAAELHRSRGGAVTMRRFRRARRRRGGPATRPEDRAPAGIALAPAACRRDLARLLAERGERRAALDLLAPIYGWFTEGFATPDLIEAKALLVELG